MVTAWWPLFREIIMLFVGLTVFVIETTHQGEPRHYVLLACAFLVGMPVAQWVDRWIGGRTTP